MPIFYRALFVPAAQTFCLEHGQIGDPYEISKSTSFRSAGSELSNYWKKAIQASGRESARVWLRWQ
jgi:hypothetical protein